jgi:hypothetical protein
MVEIISDNERVERMKAEVRKFIETQFPFKRFFPSYGIAEKLPEKSEEVVVETNQMIGVEIKATMNESEVVKVEKIVETKAEKKRHNKALKVRVGGGGVVHLHRV